MSRATIFFFICSVVLSGCTHSKGNDQDGIREAIPTVEEVDLSTKTIHVIVALCDNEHQGIVPVPEHLGNGQDPNSNLYWGTAYGVRTYFKRSSEWEYIAKMDEDDYVLERLVFKNKASGHYLVADAYDGAFIKQATVDFLLASSGRAKDTLNVNNETIGLLGNAEMLAYVGHDGLMDFDLADDYSNVDGKERDAIILACYSQDYFHDYLTAADANPVLWTTGLMAPEAYTLHDAISAYVGNESPSTIQLRAAQAYDRYQKCGVNAAKRLLVTGF